jgi:hypothetical protein
VSEGVNEPHSHNIVAQYAEALDNGERIAEAEKVRPFVDALFDTLDRWAGEAAAHLDGVRLSPVSRECHLAVRKINGWVFASTSHGTFWIRRDPMYSASMSKHQYQVCVPALCSICGAGNLPSDPATSLYDLLKVRDQYPAPISTHRCY